MIAPLLPEMDHQYANMMAGTLLSRLNSAWIFFCSLWAILPLLVFRTTAAVSSSANLMMVLGLSGHTFMAEQGAEKWAKHTAVEKLQ